MERAAATKNKVTKAPRAAAKSTAPIAQQIDVLRQHTLEMVNAGKVESAIDVLLEVISAQYDDVVALEKRTKTLQRLLWGRSSERLTREELGQLALAFDATEEEAAQDDPLVPGSMPDDEKVDPGEDERGNKGKSRKGKKKSKHAGRTRLSPNLARRITVLSVPADERDCNHCKAPMQVIGYIDHERVEYVPARLEIAVERREKLACTACRQDITEAPRASHGGADEIGGDDETAMRSTNVADMTVADTTDVDTSDAKATSDGHGGGMAPGAHIYRRAGASLLAQLLEAKADDALPVYRQREQLQRLGFEVPLNTLYGYWDAAATLVQPVAQVVFSAILGDPIIGLDDTRLDWLDPKNKSARQRGHLWCFMGTTPLVAFEFTKSWCAEEVAPWILAMEGFVQCDDYKGYEALIDRGDGKKSPLVPPDNRLGCWMHVRRRFHTAFKAGEKHAIVALGDIKELYEIEARAREKALSHDERHALRQKHALPVAERFFTWVETQKATVRPSSYLGQAVSYALAQKPFAMRCLSDGRFELDTGRVERQIREPVIGRKNYLFSGSAEAAQRLAGVYTLVCSCHNLGVSTRHYLTDIITKLEAGFPLRNINRLRPDIWAAEHPSLVAHQVHQQTAQHTAAHL